MNKEVELEYNKLCAKKSDINEHLPTLQRYATECNSVFETGVRGCVSTWAFVYGLLSNNKKDKILLLNDITNCNIEHLLKVTANLPIEISYEWKNNLDIILPHKFDLTFIDTWHVYGQLKRELAKFSEYTNKFIIMHDTTVDGVNGQTIRMGSNAQRQSVESGFPLEEINKGLWPAVEEFLEKHPEWVLHERYTNNNGLTILKRVCYVS